jgi:hypothetical protein
MGATAATSAADTKIPPSRIDLAPEFKATPMTADSMLAMDPPEAWHTSKRASKPEFNFLAIINSP